MKTENKINEYLDYYVCLFVEGNDGSEDDYKGKVVEHTFEASEFLDEEEYSEEERQRFIDTRQYIINRGEVMLDSGRFYFSVVYDNIVLKLIIDWDC